MGRQRRRFSAEFKARVALEAICMRIYKDVHFARVVDDYLARAPGAPTDTPDAPLFAHPRQAQKVLVRLTAAYRAPQRAVGLERLQAIQRDACLW